MRGRVLVVPAAGPGSRLGASGPKLLVPVAGMPMIDWLVRLYGAVTDAIILVVHPSAEPDVLQHVRAFPLAVTSALQPAPTGMLDAILLAAPAVRNTGGNEIWITWCDQVAVDPRTVRRLAEMTSRKPDAALVMPTVRRSNPYVDFQRDDAGRIIGVRHRREGDVMPDEGESDVGLFGLSAAAYHDLLPQYARDVEIGRSTRERNFLPFIPWLAKTHQVVTFPAISSMEAIGVNTPEELKVVEDYLRSRDSELS